MIKVEVVQVGDSGYLSPSRASLEDFGRRAPEVVDSIIAVAGALGKQLDSQAADADARSRWTMDEMAVSFELALEAEAGVVIARARTSATFNVEISWRRGDPK
jgi:hypothetical protein